MFASVGASLSRKFLVSVLATGFFLGVSLAVAGVVGAQQTEQMNASWYGPGFEGATTASGEPFDPYGYTAAHKTLPFGTTMEVCYEGCVNVRINDRGPFIAGRDLDLAQGAAEAIGLTAVGHATVNVTYTDGSTPAGPSGGAAPTAPRAEQPTVQPEAPAAAPSQNRANNAPQANAAADDQYAVEDQYDDGSASEDSASEDQYDDGAADENSAAGEQYDSAAADQYEPPEPAGAAPDAAALAPLAPPEPSAVEVAPLDLATPGSTVERRIQLAVAAPPVNYTGPLPEDPPAETASVAQEAPAESPATETDAEADVEKPEPGSVAAIAGMTVLPDTGGLPVMPLAGAALAASLLVVGVRAFRR